MELERGLGSRSSSQSFSGGEKNIGCVHFPFSLSLWRICVLYQMCELGHSHIVQSLVHTSHWWELHVWNKQQWYALFLPDWDETTRLIYILHMMKDFTHFWLSHVDILAHTYLKWLCWLLTQQLCQDLKSPRVNTLNIIPTNSWNVAGDSQLLILSVCWIWSSLGM